MLTKDELKIYLKIKAADTSLDTELTKIISRAVSTMEDYCGRVIVEKSGIEEWQSGDGSNQMYLNNLRVTAVSKIELLNSSYELEAFAKNDETTTDIHLTKEEFSSLIRLKSLTFTEGYKNFKVTYTAGYASADLPVSIKEFCFELCKTLFNYSNLPGSEKILGYQSKAESDKGSITTQYKDLDWKKLDKYRMVM